MQVFGLHFGTEQIRRSSVSLCDQRSSSMLHLMNALVCMMHGGEGAALLHGEQGRKQKRGPEKPAGPVLTGHQ